MDMEDMGFKKTKAAKPKEEPVRTVVNSLKETTNFNDEGMPGQACLLDKSRESHQQQSQQSHQQQQQHRQQSNHQQSRV